MKFYYLNFYRIDRGKFLVDLFGDLHGYRFQERFMMLHEHTDDVIQLHVIDRIVQMCD
jgi:hypothetical protein